MNGSTIEQSNDSIASLIDGYWDEALASLSGIVSEDRSRLMTAITAVDAVPIATSSDLGRPQETLLREFLRHRDTRLTAAERLYSPRRELEELKLETGKAESAGRPAVAARARPITAIPEGFSNTVREMATAIPRLSLFGIELPTEHYGDFCGHLVDVTERYLAIMEDAESLFFDIPTPVDAKAKDKKDAPSFWILLRAYQEGSHA